MKKLRVTTGILALIFAMLLTSCKDAETDVKETQEEVLDSRVDLLESKKEAAQAIEQFKLDIYGKISVNNEKIRDLSVKEIKGTLQEKVAYTKRIKGLQSRNDALKAKLDAYTSYNKSTYETFKNDLRENADSLERQFQSLENEN
jgi:hypothetical protein